MQENFEKSLAAVLVHEGGFSNHPHDKGGATNLGVTIGTAERLGIDVDGDGDTDIIDIKKLRPSDAGKVYRREYWSAVRGDELPAGVDLAVFDFGVNSGPTRAIMALQRALGVADDGKFGPITLKAAKQANPRILIRTICASRMAFLRKLSTWKTFGKGWTKRVAAVESEALKMVPVPLPPIAPPDIEPVPPPPPSLWARLRSWLFAQA